MSSSKYTTYIYKYILASLKSRHTYKVSLDYINCVLKLLCY